MIQYNVYTEYTRQPRIGDIYYMRFGGSHNEQSGYRPGIVFQNNIGNRFSPNIIALPLTSKIKKIGQPTHVLLLTQETGLPKDSVVLCENPERMSKERLGEYVSTLSDDVMAKIAVANILASAAISFINLDKLIETWKQAISINATTVA